MLSSETILTVLSSISLLTAIRITTKLGEIEGITSNGPLKVHQFLNIPYAEPPIGKLRWRPTVPLAKGFNGVYDATKWGNGCTQATAMHFFSNDTGAKFVEDCLYLNVFTSYNFKEPPTQKLRPVLVWIHGGGLQIGSAMTSVYNATGLVESQDIVVVPINYRLSKAAWFIDPQLIDSPTGNGGATGFLDMIEALKWVKRNIASFGGDPNEVTIAGESGGGWAICGLVLSPLARGLFKRSIQMSGSCIESLGRFKSISEGLKMTKAFADIMNLSNIEEMRDLEMIDIIDAGYGSPDAEVIPTTDGYVFPIDTIDLIKQGNVNGESTMIGTVFRESFSGHPWNMGYEAKDEEDLYKIFYPHFHDSQVELIKKHYPFGDINGKIWPFDTTFKNETALLVQTTIHTDCWVRCGSILQCDILRDNPLTKNSFPVYFYQYGTFNEPWDTVSHGHDVLQLFGKDQIIAPESSMLAGMMDDFDEEFLKITQKWVGDYVKGITPKTKDGKDASYQNGYYLRIVDGVKIIDLNELEIVKNRCKLYWDNLGETAYSQLEFCMFSLKAGTDFESFDNSTAKDTIDDKQEL